MEFLRLASASSSSKSPLPLALGVEVFAFVRAAGFSALAFGALAPFLAGCDLDFGDPKTDIVGFGSLLSCVGAAVSDWKRSYSKESGELGILTVWLSKRNDWRITRLASNKKIGSARYIDGRLDFLRRTGLRAGLNCSIDAAAQLLCSFDPMSVTVG